jgi:hypothetical protein
MIDDSTLIYQLQILKDSYKMRVTLKYHLKLYYLRCGSDSKCGYLP